MIKLHEIKFYFRFFPKQLKLNYPVRDNKTQNQVRFHKSLFLYAGETSI